MRRRFFLSTVQGSTFYVRPTATGTGDGRTYANAFGIAEILDGSAFDAIPPGAKLLFADEDTYTIDVPIVAPKPCIIQGASRTGTIIRTNVDNAAFGNDLGMVMATGITGFVIKDLTIDGRYIDDPNYIYSYGSDGVIANRSHGIVFGLNSESCLVQNVTIKNTTRAGFNAVGFNHEIRDVTIHNTASANFSIGQGSVAAGITSGIRAYNLTLSKSTGKSCIELKDGVTDVVIDGFAINGDGQGWAARTIDHAQAGASNSNLTLKNGTIDNFPDNINIAVNNNPVNTVSGIVLEDITFTNGQGDILQIAGNASNVVCRRLVSTGSISGIKCWNNDVALANPDDITFIDCDIDGASSSSSEYGIDIDTCTNVRIQGGRITNWKGHGVRINDSDNVTIETSDTQAAEIFDNGFNFADGSAIYFEGTGTGCSIDGAALGGESAQSTKCKYAITHVVGYDDLEITNNTITFPGIRAFNGDLAGTNVVMSGNTGLPVFPNTISGYTYLDSWIARCAELGVDIDSSKLTAFNSFMSDLGSDLRSRMKAGYFSFGGDAGISLVNLKDPATYQRIFENNTTSIYFPFDRTQGIKAIANGYINSKFKTDEYAGIETDLTTCVYLPTSSTTTGTDLVYGARTASATAAFSELQPLQAANTGRRRRFEVTQRNFTNANWKGLYVVTYDGTNSVVYKDGTKSSVAMTPAAPDISTYIFDLARNNAAVSDTKSVTGSLTLSYVSLKFRFNRFADADEALFRTAVTNLKTATSLP